MLRYRPTLGCLAASASWWARITGSSRRALPTRSSSSITCTAAIAAATAISATIAGTPSTHANTLPTEVTFADGVTEATVTFTIDAWQATEATSESFTLTFSGASLDETSYTTRTIRIKANTTCALDEEAGDCASC